MTAQDILDKIVELEITTNEFGHEDWTEDFENFVGQIKEIKNQHINDDAFVVFYFVDHDIYLRIDGYYSSYEGSDYSDGRIYEVRPVERMVTFYE